MRFHPESSWPMFETQRRLRGHAFFPGSAVLRKLMPKEERPAPEKAPCVVYFSPWGHLVVTELDAELNAYGWVCWTHDPGGAEWGDLGYLGEYEKRRGMPLPAWWERDLHSKDRTAAAAIERILSRYAPHEEKPAPVPEAAVTAAAPVTAAARVVARVPRTARRALR